MIYYPIPIDYVNAAEDVFSKDEGSLHMKNVFSKTNQLCYSYINIPKHLMERYQSVIVSSDFMFANGISFFITIIHNIKFITAIITKDQRIKYMIETVK